MIAYASAETSNKIMFSIIAAVLFAIRMQIPNSLIYNIKNKEFHSNN